MLLNCLANNNPKGHIAKRISQDIEVAARERFILNKKLIFTILQAIF
jgi:hypothetical protein